MNEAVLWADVDDLVTRHAELWSALKDKTVLLTGGSGFIGSFVVKLLSRLNEAYGLHITVMLIGRDSSRLRSVLGAAESLDRVVLLEQDVRGRVKIPQAVDYVIHGASHADPGSYMADPVGTITTNVLGTMNLLDALRDQSVINMLFLSTVEVYGAHGHTGAIGEGSVGAIDPMVVRNCYPLSKSCAENLCLCYSAQYGVPVTVARLAYVYGPGSHLDDPKVVTAFISALQRGEDLVLKSAATQRRTYCYIKDAVFGLLLALLRGEQGEVYNVSSMNSVVSVRGIADALLDLFGDGAQRVIYRDPSETERGSFSLAQDNVLDNRKIRALGYEETVDVVQGLRNTGRYFGLANTDEPGLPASELSMQVRFAQTDHKQVSR